MNIISAVLAGLLAGVLVNYFADVLPAHRRIVYPTCRDCGRKYPPLDFFVFPRRCRECNGGRNPVKTVLIYAIYAAIGYWMWYSPPEKLGFIAGLVVLAYLGLIAIIDIEHRLILNSTSLAGIVLGVGIGFWLHGLSATIIGGLVGFLIMLSLYIFGAGLMGWLAKKRGQKLEEEALGFGDVNLAGVLGLILGWPGILLGVLLTILLAGIFSMAYLLISLLVRRYKFDLAIPYGPFLVSSAIALLYFRELVLKYFGW